MQITIDVPSQSQKLHFSVASGLLKDMYRKLPLILVTLQIDNMHIYYTNSNRSPQGLYTAPESIELYKQFRN